MTLKSLLDDIAKLAIRQKCIQYSAAGTSLYQLNPKNIDAYPVLFQSPTGDHTINENSITYEISLYYLDRLLEDNSNDIDIYSAAISQLQNIVKGIEEMPQVLKVNEGYTITNFSDVESFDDRLAGAFTSIEIVTEKNNVCYEGE